MNKINWHDEVNKRRDSLLEQTQKLLQINSVLDESDHKPDDAPLGKGVKEALQFMLDLGDKDGFTVKNVGNLAGHIEFGQGEELLGILCHVDVVPEGDGWASDPYGADIRDGKIYARGAIDDKGPTMGAYFAMKIIKELGLPLNKRVRMIIGTDEESDWRCVNHYFEHEEMPTFGFAPDADFPIIYAEKGISDFDLVQKPASIDLQSDQIEVISFEAGRRYNMVPDFAMASLGVPQYQDTIVQSFDDFLLTKDVKGKYFVNRGELVLEVEGVSAHGMEPNNGKNAGLLLASFLERLNLEVQAQEFFAFVNKYFAEDSRGESLGIAFSDDITGELTINVGKLAYSSQSGGMLGLNLRYPVSTDFAATKRYLERVAEENSFSVENFSNSKPHHVDEDDFLIQTLQKVYEEQTGEKAELLSIGGGTYARSLESGVAFGPLFPGRPDIAHQKDEYIIIEDLLKATAIYAQAIYELAR